jgi:hypothetical protein
VFFLSDDDRFLVKTVSHEEMGLLLRMMPRYTAHCGANPATLLTRFYGVHRIKHLSRGGTKARAQKLSLAVSTNSLSTLHADGGTGRQCRATNEGFTASRRGCVELLSRVQARIRPAKEQCLHALSRKGLHAALHLLPQVSLVA